MPLYFIDTDDGDLHVKDEEGQDLENREKARAAALRALPDMARERLPMGDQRTFTSNVRDENGRVIYSATLTIDGHWNG